MPALMKRRTVIRHLSLRGGNRNISFMAFTEIPLPSPLAQRCEWKLHQLVTNFTRHFSHLSRRGVNGNYYIFCSSIQFLVTSHSEVGIETSSLNNRSKHFSHLSRRGVNRNFVKNDPNVSPLRVTSRAEVWIETTMMMVLKMIKAVTSRAEVWIETAPR